jgi:hypothetical protein
MEVQSMKRRLIILTLLLSSCSPSIMKESWVADMQSDAGLDSTARQGFWEAIRNLTSPELEQRKKTRRDCQRRHYAETLYEMVLSDAPGALLAAARSRLQLELELPDRPLTVTIPVKQPPSRPGAPPSTAQTSPPFVFTLYENREFPVDPWGPP